ncbi:sensor histidine kinase [Brevibacillus massiliensis]|jgi:signal transduction histidine kinase|uniref:sensor histidine kinase n=1 Tax=Brevibacillus massiliensis TaxID=1118054 RepID=UPI00030E5874|nr:ATP-binding protein [Brevibacillus massiliensis]
MIDTNLLNLEEISEKIITLNPTITERWLHEVKEKMIEVTIPIEFAEGRTILIARSLVEDVQAELQAWSLDMGVWLRAKHYPLSSILRSFQLFRNVFWNVLRPALPSLTLTQQETIYLEKRIGEAIDESLYWAVYHFEQLVNAELTQKEETITYLHNDKLTILGKLAANMAHELRNPLCAIEGFLKLIQESTQGQKDLESYIHVIMHEFDNLHRQITGFLSFSKKPILDEVFKKVDLKQLLNEVEVLITPRLIAENIILERDIDDCSLYCYQEGLKQVLVNLFNNAIEAVQLRADKRIRIISCCTDEKVTIVVENNGEQIPDEIVGQLFHPFFSTKDNGTGIGLSICKNIIEKHNGTIRCQSSAESTKFTITIPHLHGE